MWNSDHVELRYKNDNDFRAVVDWLRSLLGVYHLTPGELRQAAVLAATMHEMENVKPLLIKPWDNSPCTSGLMGYASGAPTLYGGDPKAGTTGRTASGAEHSAPKTVGHVFLQCAGQSFKRCIFCDLSEVYTNYFKIDCTKGIRRSLRVGLVVY